MAVLIEGISVIIPTNTLRDRHTGGWDAFLAEAPNLTLCADGDLARLGFLTPDEAHAYCLHLETRGLRGLTDAGEAADFAVIDQLRGPLAPCPWLELGLVACAEGGPLRAARLLGSTDEQVAVPPGWTWDSSLTKQLTENSLDTDLAAMPVPGSGCDN
jgi:hypothetical protein